MNDWYHEDGWCSILDEHGVEIIVANSAEVAAEVMRTRARAETAEARVAELERACESVIHDLRSHDYDDEGGYIDSTEQELRQALGLCPDCMYGMEQYGRARLTCGTCKGTGKRKEGGA